ncbi:hypothetical protein LSTR_LSTR012240 [Laodelphax striatellus]|uniref:Uncharacterized protein n=1 Tax=Laodelphax striatellus TaxID=195883 RepID=A0A482X8X5_LAOST|nr:hypothetical protein LSTR_LSTR012240 [Laodelphax striatellus]
MSSDCFFKQSAQKNELSANRSGLQLTENEDDSVKPKPNRDCYSKRSSPCFLKSCNLYCSHASSPRKSLRKTIPILVFNTWPNPRLSHCIEDDDDDGEWLLADKKLQGITCGATCMQQHMRDLRHDYEELENSTSHLLAEAQHLVADLRDVRNLEILLQLQNGNLENLSLQKWPFSAMSQKSTSSASSPDTNLIV